MFFNNKSDKDLLKLIFFIPIIALSLYLTISLSIEFYLQYYYYNKRVDYNKKRLIEHRKDIVKERVDYIFKIIEFNRNIMSEKESQKYILDFVNNTKFPNGGYIFIYKLLDIDGGKRFAKMIANPNRKDLINRYISDDYIDAKGKMFRKEFLKGIRDSGESFVIYHYKKFGKDKISKKISYFKLYNKWNWIIASGIYLDIDKEIIDRENQLLKNILRNKTNISILISIIILLVVLYISEIFKQLIEKRFKEYRDDITYKEKILKEKNKLLIKQLYTDSLTLKKNRNALEKDLRENSYSCMIIIDIDNFRWLNDLYGTEKANTILINMAKILEEFKNRYNLKYNIYRIGSDQFVLLFFSKDIVKSIKELTKRMVIFISEYKIYLSENEWIHINTTLGVSCYTKDLLFTADMALNRAKVSSVKYVIYDRSIDRRAFSKKIFDLKKRIEDALANGNIVPFYQPIVDRECKIVKYEVLARIKEDNIYIVPGVFLDISKKLKLYLKISETIIKKSFDYFREYNKEFSINISIIDMKSENIKSLLEDELSKDIEFSKKVTIEILESENIDDIEIFNNFVELVRGYGVKIAIDDFGSGYSTFSNLLIIKPDIIKIDSNIIKDVDIDKSKQELVKIIVATAKVLNAITIAEYVSSESIFNTLLKLGVEQFQGYYISRPKEDIFT